MAIGKKLKDYLNNEESQNIFWLYATAENMVNYRKSMVDTGNITAEEHRSLKMAETHLKKFIKLLLSRLSAKTKKNFVSKFYKHEIRIIDHRTLSRLNGQWQDELKIVKMKREEFEDFCELIMESKCKGCNINPDTCNLYDILDDNMVPTICSEVSCKYAYEK